MTSGTQRIEPAPSAARPRGTGQVAHASGKPTLTAVAPATVYVIALLVLPFLMLVYLSVHQSDSVGGIKAGISLHNYVQLVDSPVYFDSVIGTARLALVVTACSLLIGYPIAWFLARSRSYFVPLATAVVVVPLFVSVVVRSFGWMVLLGREGTLNAVLLALGLIPEPVQFLYTESAVTLGLVHILVPLMILPIASVLRGIDSSLDEAARSLGASGAKAIWTVTFPLSLPGVGAGCVLVFSHGIAAFVLPALIGSERVKLVATMIYQQVMVIGNVPLGAALGVVMVIATFALIGLAQMLSRRVAA